MKLHVVDMAKRHGDRIHHPLFQCDVNLIIRNHSRCRAKMTIDPNLNAISGVRISNCYSQRL